MDEISRRITDAPDAVKAAVKEALNDKRMEDMARQNQDILDKMAEGFTKITTRQDIANGRTAKNEDKIKIMKIKSSNSLVYTHILWFLVTSLVSVIVFLTTHKCMME